MNEKEILSKTQENICQIYKVLFDLNKQQKKEAGGGMFTRLMTKKIIASVGSESDDENEKQQDQDAGNKVLDHFGKKLQFTIDKNNEGERQRRSLLVYGTVNMRDKKGEQAFMKQLSKDKQKQN